MDLLVESSSSGSSERLRRGGMSCAVEQIFSRAGF